MSEKLFKLAEEMEKKYPFTEPMDRFSRGAKAKELAEKAFRSLSELESLLDPNYIVEGSLKKEAKELVAKSYTVFQKLSDIFTK